jgi:tRNA A37 threonylcarbamoyltransferase TsaD
MVGSAAGSAEQADPYKIAVVAAVVAATGPGVTGALLVTTGKSLRLAIMLQIPALVIGFAVVIAGLVLFLQKPSPVLSLPLVCGGAVALVEALCNMQVCVHARRQRQSRQTRK